MITLENLSVSLGGRTILDKLSFSMMEGWRIGVVGNNGAGKSTLFKLISGALEADMGVIKVPSNRRIGMIAQELPDHTQNLMETVINSDPLLAGLLEETLTCEDPDRLGEVYEQLTNLDGFTAEARASTILTGLGFAHADLTRPLSEFSGGWRMRVALAGVLFMQPDLLLLDEPTNHLDIEAIIWLEQYLASYPNGFMIISHDRDMLNKCTNKILHIHRQQATIYTGNYDQFEQERAQKQGQQQKMFEKQQAQREHLQSFIDRFKAKASKARQAQSRVKALERMSMVDAILMDRAIQFRFPSPPKLTHQLIKLETVSVGYGAAPPILTNLSERIEAGDRIALLGANGSGKSTMIKLIAGELAAQAGNMERANKLNIGYFAQHQAESLDGKLTPYQALYQRVEALKGDLKETSLRSKLGAFGFNRDLSDTTINRLSGGEKARLLFAMMSLNRPNLLLLDEPTNHLDMDAREALIHALNDFEGAVIMVSHDSSMIERVADQLWLINDGTCQHFDGDFQDYRRFVLQAGNPSKQNSAGKKSKSHKNQSSPPPKAKSKPNQQEIDKLEAKITRLTQEKQALEAKLAQPELYQNKQQLSMLQKDYADCVETLETLEAKWLSLSS
ncbi:MAG: ABC-F family ATP-binding cassette domain-containing protein [Alphaproteobacteria bacterium]